MEIKFTKAISRLLRKIDTVIVHLINSHRTQWIKAKNGDIRCLTFPDI